jgi:hypothetical protein
MALMDVFTHFSIIRRERRGIRPEEIKPDPTIKFDNTLKGLSALGGEQSRYFNTKVVTVHHSVVKRLKAFSDYRPKSLEPFLQALLDSDQKTE